MTFNCIFYWELSCGFMINKKSKPNQRMKKYWGFILPIQDKLNLHVGYIESH